ncbi:hypothetical protein WU87_08285 [Corynebacterium minutissimum]|uniref:Uncharacterized protein n=1 Tax=Corynebacterium minutissimum TaxID=38301 RepID=A0ACC4UAS1_9CORY|nr:hypothetical protein WU87_08285 [Corynebacterium minutissimum]
MNVKKFNGSIRRRGTTIAAAALSVAMVGPFVHPVVNPTAAPAAFAQQNQPAADQANQIIDADMIASGRVTKPANLTDAHGVGKGLISGHVYLATPGGNPGASYDNGNVKMDGITVYAQFRDKDGSYSPIFSAKTHNLEGTQVGGNGGQGTFAFGTGDKGITWTDKLGNEHTWSARTDQQHRIWVEPFTNDRGNRVEMFRQANGWTPGSFNGVVDGPMGSFVAADGNMQLMAAFLREVPPNHKESWMAAKGDKLIEDPLGPDPAAALQHGKESNMLSGQVWLETGGSPDWGFPATGPKRDSVTQDPAADGYTVFASTLTKDGAAANAELHAKYKNDPDKLSEETKKMLEAHPEYILKTVYGKTDPEGNYSLRFGNYTDKNQTREDFLNPDHVFVWVENKDGIVQNGYTGFHTPIFQRFNVGGNFIPADEAPAENQVITALVSDKGDPRYGKPLNKIYNVRHALMPYAPVSIKADYNATDKPASPGVTVTPEFSGELSPLPSKIEWRDKDGEVVKTCKLDQSKTAKDQVAACTFEIPAEAKKGDVYNVVVVSGGNDVAAWSVLVTKDADELAPSYEEKLVVPGKETKSSPTFTKVDEKGNPTDEKVDAPEGSKFTIPEDFKAPEGYEVKIDENTGEITVTFPDKSKLNKDTVEEFDVPVTVTYPDGSKDDAKAKFKLDTDGDGTPDTKDPDDDGDGVPDDKEKEDNTNPKLPPQAGEYEPGYEDGSGKPGDEVKVPAPKFKDKDGNDTKAPEGTKFTPGENVPDGVKIDENTGEITVTIPEGAKPEDKITVPVVVTYPDGTKDNVDVTVTVEAPDAPATKDNENFEPEYNGGTGQPGDDVKINKPEFKDGDNNKVTPPEGTTFGPGENVPDGVTIHENTGEITVTIPEDAKPGDKITVPVEVTYPDVSKDNVNVTITVTEKDAAPVTPAAPKENNPSLGASADDPASCDIPPYVTVEKTEGVEYKVTVDGKELTPDVEGKYVYEYGQTVKVEAFPTEGYTFPEGTQTTWTYTTEQNEVCEEPEVEKPDWTDDKGKPGDKVEIPNTGGDVPGGTTVETEGPGKAEIDKGGKLIVDIDKDAKPGDKVVVIVKDKDGNEIDRVVVEVEQPDAPADKPDWKDDKGKPGDKVEIPNTGGDVPGGTTVETEGPGKAEIDKDGNLIVDIDKDAKPGDKITVIVKDKDGNEIDTVTVTVEKPNDNGGGHDGWNPPGQNNPDKPGKDDPSETPEVIKPTIDPAKDGDKEITGTAKPGTDITVTVIDKDGKKTEKTVKVGDDGKWKVVVDKELKTGDKIVAKDKDGNEASRIVTGDSKPSPKPDGSADWTGSSNLSERCINTGLGIGIPLLFLIPVGLASQMNIPGLSEFVAPINKQIQDLNTRLQQQAGLFNGPLADQVNGINAQLKRFGADYQQAAGAVALIAAGALAIGLLADACAPGADEGSSK